MGEKREEACILSSVAMSDVNASAVVVSGIEHRLDHVTVRISA